MTVTDETADLVLEVDDLRVDYRTSTGDVHAVNGVSFDVRKGESVGLVGESGSGKSTTAMAVLGLTSPPGRVVGGSVRIQGEDVLGMSERDLRDRRWRTFSLIPQGSMNSLNPILRVCDQIGDAIDAHERVSRRDRRDRIMALLAAVNLPARTYGMYPHELSGGMKQRVCIAAAIALKPALLIADEPTSALDVVVQKAVAETLLDVKAQVGCSMIMIGHDMAMQAQMVDRIAVMFGGNLVEVAPVRSLFSDPRHPYTQHLIASVPSIREVKPALAAHAASPDLMLRRITPHLVEVAPDHFVAMPPDETEEVPA